MATTSDFSVSLSHRLFQALADTGWTPGEVDNLAQDQPSLREFRDVRLGAAEITATKRLRAVETLGLPARSEPFTPAGYFQTKDGLNVWHGFKSGVLSATSTAETTPAQEVASFDLLKNAADEQVRAELPQDHVFQDVNVFCSHLAGLLDRQAGGREDGPLLTNGCANIFYVQVADEVVAVDACWYADRQGWYVRAYGLGGRHRCVGFRVFSATAAS